MKPTRKVSRRSFMATVAGGAVAGAVAITVGTEAAEAQTGVTNRDPSDPVGGGRTGITNSDPRDRPGYGRYRSGGRRRRTGCTNSDPRDPGGNGPCRRRRGRTGITNRDPYDPVGNGRY